MLSKKCPKDARIVQFTPEMIEATLDEHNKLRNEVAMGKVKGIEHLKKAKRMATMVMQNYRTETKQNPRNLFSIFSEILGLGR